MGGAGAGGGGATGDGTGRLSPAKAGQQANAGGATVRLSSSERDVMRPLCTVSVSCNMDVQILEIC